MQSKYLILKLTQLRKNVIAVHTRTTYDTILAQRLTDESTLCLRCSTLPSEPAGQMFQPQGFNRANITTGNFVVIKFLIRYEVS